MKINNYDAIIEELTTMLLNLDVDQNDFQIDIYIYVRDDGDAYLYQFENPGGNSWLNDDHIILYEDKPHYDDYYEGFYEYDEDGELIPYSDEDLRAYLEEFMSEYVDTAYNILEKAGIESI